MLQNEHANLGWRPVVLQHLPALLQHNRGSRDAAGTSAAHTKLPWHVLSRFWDSSSV